MLSRTLRTLCLLACPLSLLAGSVAIAGPAVQRLTYNSANTDEKVVALTFDDGPHAAHTPRLLDLLAKRHIKATFFVLGECVSSYPDLLKREVAEGHEIGDHSWNHPNLAKLSDETVKGQLQRTHDIIQQTAGVDTRLVRPPYGSFSERQKHWATSQLGFNLIYWDVDPLDWKRPGPSVVASRILKQARSGSIILMHDIHGPSIDAVPMVLDGLLAKGYRFVTVSELLAMDRPGSRKDIGKDAPKGEPASYAPADAPAKVEKAADAPEASAPAKPAPPTVPEKKNDLPDSL
jgi:peptidoglycan/xylan/chitin deacetylase (PgdA/CDA1 family)